MTSKKLGIHNCWVLSCAWAIHGHLSTFIGVCGGVSIVHRHECVCIPVNFIKPVYRATCWRKCLPHHQLLSVYKLAYKRLRPHKSSLIPWQGWQVLLWRNWQLLRSRVPECQHSYPPCLDFLQFSCSFHPFPASQAVKGMIRCPLSLSIQQLEIYTGTFNHSQRRLSVQRWPQHYSLSINIV